ncbi:gluconokinase [Endozoicomonas numazuensis]|uniref:Gluconokinase n=1 Tax=Endozoicomonas numazuensis TaxID=1137799 RepID=A0A081NEW8_9GAMM|nr:gluconokinase [Endozoicomonas numazuensis]KEQ16991.1 gluconate kinase [Endozoicomonas numazuensis]
MAGKVFVVMGVCGSGKSTVGEALSHEMGAKFIDGDDLHPRKNIEKMAGGSPLNDEDRQPWLERIRDVAYSVEAKNEVAVVVCSALKLKYRDTIREGNKRVYFLHMDGSFNLILERMKARKGHFMRETMLQSQFGTLEAPEDNESGVVRIDISGDIKQVVAACSQAVVDLSGEIAA